MAIDDAEKRKSALGAGLTPGTNLPTPDGTIDAGDRATLAGAYSGLAADAPSLVGGSGMPSVFIWSIFGVK